MAAFRDTIYAINGNAGAFVAIPVTLGFCRRMDIKETFAAGGNPNPQGLQVQFWNRETLAWGPTIQYGPGETVYVGDSIPEGQGQGAVLGLPAQAAFFPDSRGATNRAADTPVRIISGTAAATTIKVKEYQ